jgi:signal transduction histidine kinase
MARRTLFVTYIAAYLLVVVRIIRYLVRFPEYSFWSITLLIGYLILLFTEPLMTHRIKYYTHIYLFIQTAIICMFALITPNVDFWTVLFLPLILLVMRFFSLRTGFLIIGIFSVIIAILLLMGFGAKVGLPLVFINIISAFLIAAFISIIREAEAARDEIQKKHAELMETQEALRQSEREKAITEERSRLARELHDSVTQSLHSSTLMAEAGQRLASAGDIQRARGYLIRLGEISQQALREMRLLVYELRPLALKEFGLVGALQQRLDAVERRSGLEAQLSIEEELELPASIEEELFRVAMEALNNALKHANPARITVALRKEENRETPCIELSIMDDGIGFIPDTKDDEGGLGLVSMQERIDKLGGELTILSTPGEGTQVKACVNLETPSPSHDAEEA